MLKTASFRLLTVIYAALSIHQYLEHHYGYMVADILLTAAFWFAGDIELNKLRSGRELRAREGKQ